MAHYEIAIDPGLTGTGYAVWRDYEKAPMCWGSIYPGKVKFRTLMQKADHMGRLFDGLLKVYIEHMGASSGVKKVYCEQAGFFETRKGRAAARKGNIVKLCINTGMYAGICMMHGIPFELIPVKKWKGTMKKPAVKAAIVRRLGKIKATSHAWDAIGIGLHCRGAWIK